MRSLKPLVLPDWLRERRLELGMPPDSAVHQPLGQLLLKGAVLGSLLVLTPFALLVVLENQQRRLEAEVLELVEEAPLPPKFVRDHREAHRAVRVAHLANVFVDVAPILELWLQQTPILVKIACVAQTDAQMGPSRPKTGR